MVNNLKLSNLINMEERHDCGRICTEDYEEIINQKFTISSRCEVQHKGVVKGYIFRTGDTTTIGSTSCTKVHGQRKVCSPCKKLKRFLTHIKSKQEPMEYESDQDTESESEQGEIRKRVENPVCRWRDCEGGEFEDINELNHHIEKHIPQLLNLPPSDRIFICPWRDCKTTCRKRSLLVKHIYGSHSGNCERKKADVYSCKI